jgi:TrmH family RNA methyltransferase
MIRSHNNPRVKACLRLRSSRTRRSESKFLIDGLTELRRAVGFGIRLETVFYAGDAARQQLTELNLAPSILWEVSPEILSKLNYGQQSQQIVAVAHPPGTCLADLPLHENSLILALDRTEKPGNLGACLRTAAACAVDAALLIDPICELFNPNTIRASRGAVFSLPVACGTSEDIRMLCHRLGLRLMTARVDAKQGLWETDFCGGCVLLFGNEAEGLGPEWDTFSHESFRIPMAGEPDSLNLSISTAVTLYEAVRQRSATNV